MAAGTPPSRVALRAITPTGKPPPLAVRLEKALPFRRWVAARASCGGAPRPRPRPNPKHNAENDGQEAHQAMRQSEKRGRGATHASQPHEGCPLLHPLQGVSCLSTPLQGGILKPPALRVVDYLEVYNTHAAHPYRWTYAGQPLVRATPFSHTRRQQRHGRAWLSSRPQRFERTLYPPRPYKRAAAELAANL